ncbi:hypothetical protein Bhyg_12371 [Pseudolycoriella hygida]|uniref:Uncharacterized protein n=1 Tax=Pseudolycoriella hygida TaxID=35572 RepID=A0A9Q0MYR5_9DIPT|nr:hypothetical protein Bhyg_12371 [Pseudolycoriella hygida]
MGGKDQCDREAAIFKACAHKWNRSQLLNSFGTSESGWIIRLRFGFGSVLRTKNCKGSVLGFGSKVKIRFCDSVLYVKNLEVLGFGSEARSNVRLRVRQVFAGTESDSSPDVTPLVDDVMVAGAAFDKVKSVPLPEPNADAEAQPCIGLAALLAQQLQAAATG